MEVNLIDTNTVDDNGDVVYYFVIEEKTYIAIRRLQ